MDLILDTHKTEYTWQVFYIDGFDQDCSISSALAMEILQSCTKPSTCPMLSDMSV